MKGNRLFWHVFHGRGMTVAKLAEGIASGRAHVTQVLNGSRPGSQTRRRIIRMCLLTAEELRLLGWEVPHGTMCHVEPSSLPSRVIEL